MYIYYANQYIYLIYTVFSDCSSLTYVLKEADLVWPLFKLHLNIQTLLENLVGVVQSISECTLKKFNEKPCQ